MIRMLVVDDEQAFSAMVSGYFSNFGCEVVSAVSAEEALQVCPVFRPDICVVDNRLPGMSGAQLIKQIRLFDRNVFIAMCTIDRQEDALTGLARDDIDLFFKKPLLFSAFCDALIGAMARITSGNAGRRL